MSSRTCPDWPALTEIAPDLQFKHYTVAEARLPGDALMTLPDLSLNEVAICADLDKNVFYAEHTDPSVAEAPTPLPEACAEAAVGQLRKFHFRPIRGTDMRGIPR